jgi:hypothetical protein
LWGPCEENACVIGDDKGGGSLIYRWEEMNEILRDGLQFVRDNL